METESTSLADCVSNVALLFGVFVGCKVIKTHQIERTLRIAKELSDLIVYCRPVSYDTEKGKV